MNVYLTAVAHVMFLILLFLIAPFLNLPVPTFVIIMAVGFGYRPLISFLNKGTEKSGDYLNVFIITFVVVLFLLN
ncbi:hypothetical protein MWH25_08070 [Natroniella acetigena]|uniref:hypothetical protein n=1 Tax=Natroniella acetigena TaxID=52004 RepID=UPI00200A6153|nr:hypothetical protein [Natroniella acetigena]MCK8827698.1 hypothetical protein [Natroniella acetigena]